MTETTGSDQAVAVALSEMRRAIDVGLAQIQGDLRLLLQRADQSDRRGDEHAARLDGIETRMRAVEQTAVSEADLDARTRRVWITLGTLAAMVGAGAGTIVPLLTH